MASSSSAPSDPTTGIVERFRALALSEGLKKKSDKYKERRKAFIADAVEDGFIATFGVNNSSLQSWQRLCTIVGIPAAETLLSIKKCKAALKGTFVNIVDLVDAAAAGKVMTKGVFNDITSLRRYIKNTKKMFPRGRAKRNPLLRHFLIMVN
ncbi:hypothetical protein CPB85DRAFT_1429785 [Mucidula mucida]|nr:hypothetical protein CPB85DRAFT_1429785 [Mucidula mucida]